MYIYIVFFFCFVSMIYYSKSISYKESMTSQCCSALGEKEEECLKYIEEKRSNWSVACGNGPCSNKNPGCEAGHALQKNIPWFSSLQPTYTHNYSNTIAEFIKRSGIN